MSLNLKLMAYPASIAATDNRRGNNAVFYTLTQTPTEFTLEVIDLQTAKGFKPALALYRKWLIDRWPSPADRWALDDRSKPLNQWLRVLRKAGFTFEFVTY